MTNIEVLELLRKACLGIDAANDIQEDDADAWTDCKTAIHEAIYIALCAIYADTEAAGAVMEWFPEYSADEAFPWSAKMARARALLEP